MGIIKEIKSYLRRTSTSLISAWQLAAKKIQSAPKSLRWTPAIELTLVFGWSVLVSKVYLNFDPFIWPLGGDYPLTIEPLFIWKSLSDCGSCVFWNGLINGGYPSFAEAHAPMLHPLAVIPSLIFGVINGSKITLVMSFFIAGAAQWWLGLELGIRRLARLWAAGLVVVGAHLAGRMDMGLYAVVLSTAFASLVIPAVLRLRTSRSNASVAVLAIALSLTWLAGQGYLQIALIASLVVALAAFGIGTNSAATNFRNKLPVALALSFLLSSIFLVPFLRFFPGFEKFIDPNIEASQPLAYVPLNFILSDFDLQRSTLLGKIGFPGIYLDYIGWTPIFLAIWGAHRSLKERRRTIYFLVGSIVLIMLMASDEWNNLLKSIWRQAAISIRYPPLFLGLAVPLILALASLGIDDLLQIKWPQLKLSLSTDRSIQFNLLPLVLLVILPLSIKQVYGFSRDLMKVQEVKWEVYGLGDHIDHEQAEWVKPPPDHYWQPFLLSRGIKLTEIFRPWAWKDRPPPEPAQVVAWLEPEDGSSIQEQLGVARFDDVFYASVQTAGEVIPCQATAEGGNIDVNCQMDERGLLIVEENSFPGWRAWQDNQRIDLIGGRWLAVNKSKGTHTYQFRYRPLDIPLGIILSIGGLLICAWMIFEDQKAKFKIPAV